MAEKIQNVRFISMFRFLRQKFYLVGAITSNKFHLSCSNVLYMSLITNFPTNSITAKKFKITVFRFFRILRSYLYHMGAISCPCILMKLVMHATDSQFLVKINNGGGILIVECALVLYINHYKFLEVLIRFQHFPDLWYWWGKLMAGNCQLSLFCEYYHKMYHLPRTFPKKNMCTLAISF